MILKITAITDVSWNNRDDNSCKKYYYFSELRPSELSLVSNARATSADTFVASPKAQPSRPKSVTKRQYLLLKLETKTSPSLDIAPDELLQNDHVRANF